MCSLGIVLQSVRKTGPGSVFAKLLIFCAVSAATVSFSLFSIHVAIIAQMMSKPFMYCGHMTLNARNDSGLFIIHRYLKPIK